MPPSAVSPISSPTFMIHHHHNNHPFISQRQTSEMHLRDIFLLAVSAISTPILSSPVNPTTLSLRSLLSARQRNVVDEFHGKARVLVVNSDIFVLNKPLDKLLGCINADGKVIPVTNGDKSACQVFEKTSRDYRDKIISPSGNNCTFHNKLQPANVDSYYGQDSYAFYCGKTEAVEWEYGWSDADHFYTVTGFPQVYVCTGNLVCTYDMPAPPAGWGSVTKGVQAGSYDALPIWQFFWGSVEPGVVGGHVEVMLIWDFSED
ncbi:hypothetical protein V8F06_007027 [Rhypophila decipiens]